MQHVVFWSTPAGPTFQRVPALADAVDLVQRLRNEHDVTDAEVHALTAVPLNFRTVVVVEAVGVPSATPAQPLPDLPPVPAGLAAPAAHPVEDYGVEDDGVEDYGAELAPLGASVPGVVPDPVGPFRSLASVGSPQESEEAVEAADYRPLEIVARAIADAESAQPQVMAQGEYDAEPAPRSLGLFA